MSTPEYDIAICGAGPVGLALALQLCRRGGEARRIALIDAKPLEQAIRDPRAIALSYGSRQLLEDIDCWPVAATPITRIHVSRRGHFGRTVIDAADMDVDALGYVARYGALVEALSAAAARFDLAILRPLHASSCAEDADGVDLRLAEGSALRAGVLVQAEGGVFSEQAARTVRRDYEQTGIIAHVTTDKPAAGIAYERFTDEGPLALLPQDEGYALVWCARPATASWLQGLDDRHFLAELQAAFGARAGRFMGTSPRHAYPLGLNAQSAASARTVAIGNAAQTLHPVAGQGLNLGLRDAAVLAQLLATASATDAVAGFVSKRATDRGVTIRLTDTLARLFAHPFAPTQALLGAALGLTDMLPGAKRALAEHMMYGHR